jgi:predicted benzoate:H+ symporter BenE
MTPAAYHRIVERGEDTERFHSVAGKLLVAAMLTLPVGMCGDLFVVVRKITDSISAAVVSGVVMLSLFYGLWFGFTTYRRSRLQN